MAAQSGEVVYQAGEDVNLEELWDDTALIKAYEKAINSFKYGMDGNESSENKKKNRRKRKKNKKQATKELCDEFDENNVDKSTTKWMVGDRCQAVYSEDGLLYEAEIIEIYAPSTDTCLVRYTAYGNEEEQYLSDLLPLQYFENGGEDYSHGMTTNENGVHVTDSGYHGTSSQSWCISDLCRAPEPPHYHLHEAVINSFPTQYTCKVTFIKSRQSHEVKKAELQTEDYEPPCTDHATHFHHPQQNMGIPRPPIPPLPPSAMSLDGIQSDEESLASMLMSWYLSGYHTGYYKAVQQFRASSTSHVSSNIKKDHLPTTSEQSPGQAEMDTKE